MFSYTSTCLVNQIFQSYSCYFKMVKHIQSIQWEHHWRPTGNTRVIRHSKVHAWNLWTGGLASLASGFGTGPHGIPINNILKALANQPYLFNSFARVGLCVIDGVFLLQRSCWPPTSFLARLLNAMAVEFACLEILDWWTYVWKGTPLIAAVHQLELTRKTNIWICLGWFQKQIFRD